MGTHLFGSPCIYERFLAMTTSAAIHQKTAKGLFKQVACSLHLVQQEIDLTAELLFEKFSL